MNLAQKIIPLPLICEESDGVVCQLAKLNWIEADPVHFLSVKKINDTLKQLEIKPLPFQPGKMNIGTRQRISLQTDPKLESEAYDLYIGNETIVITGGSNAGVFHGTQTLCQIMTLAAAFGGHDRYVPVATIHDKPRFQYRGIMLDSARHFQKKKIILKLIDQMALYKFNRLHWHLTDRQSWRLPLDCAPELVRSVPRSRSYNSGSYSKADIEEIRCYAEERYIQIIPELEMSGHSAAVFFTHPELACPISAHPYADDFWEFCIGNPAVVKFLSAILEELAAMFPNSPLIHIGGDEASSTHWEKCPVCQKAMAKQNCHSVHELEAAFMSRMEQEVSALGRQAVSWGIPGQTGANFSEKIIIQN